MSHDSKYAKPGAGTPGFARSFFSAVVFFFYRTGVAGAIPGFPLFPAAFDGARGVAALLWGGLQ